MMTTQDNHQELFLSTSTIRNTDKDTQNYAKPSSKLSKKTHTQRSTEED